MKKGNTRYGWISTLGASFDDDNGFIFDFDNEEIAVVFNAFGKVTNTKVVKYANGWYRFILIFNATATTGLDASFTAGMTKSPSTMTDHDSGDFVYFWGAQLEEGSYASSYIPTEGSAVTRAAESIEGLNLGNFLGDSEGGLYVDALAFDVTANNIISLNDGSVFNKVELYIGRNNGIEGRVFKDGIDGQFLRASGTSPNTFYKVALTYANNRFTGYDSGARVGTEDTSVSTFSDGTLTAVNFDNAGGGNLFRGLLHELRIYSADQTDSQLATLTS